MEEIYRAVTSLDHILSSLEEHELSETTIHYLVDILNHLLPFIESDPDSMEKNWPHYFCRLLNRLLDYNHHFPDEFWKEFYYILCGLHEQGPGEGMEKHLNRRRNMINFEQELEHRQLRFQQSIGEKIDLKELIHRYPEFFQKYLEKCVAFHSKMKVHSLIDSDASLFCKNYGIDEVCRNSEKWNSLKRKLKSLGINFDCSNRLFEDLSAQFSTAKDILERNSISLDSIIPSPRKIEDSRWHKFDQITNMLQCHRWIVILGDPGSAKTTLLRWITTSFSRAAIDGDDYLVLENDTYLSIRIPVLIRIGEFATWHRENPTASLMTYIGQHTWHSQLYCVSSDQNILKEVILQGHALILLDGIDEIPEIEKRREIVELIRTFIHEHVRSPDFISAFDDLFFDDMPKYYFCSQVIERQPPSTSSGNQIIVTSRKVGYLSHPLVGACMRHYEILSMKSKEAQNFINTWMFQIEKSIHEVLVNEGIQFDKEQVRVLFERRHAAVESIFRNGSELLISNPSLLILICTFICRSYQDFYPKSRVEIYHGVVETALDSWISADSIITRNVLNNLLIELACHLHFNAPSGLIDEFDLKTLCCLSLKRQELSSDSKRIAEYVDRFLSSVDTNVGIFAERGLQVFGFLHLSFQEYFVAQSFVKGCPQTVVKHILAFIINPRFREAILLAVDWMSWKWPFSAYDKVCEFLLTLTTEYSLPFGAILLLDALDSIQKLPSYSVLCIVLNSILDHSYFPNRAAYLISSLCTLDEDIIVRWMQSHLKNEKRVINFCQCLLKANTKFRDETIADQKLVPCFVLQQLESLHNSHVNARLIVDQTLRRVVKTFGKSSRIFNERLSVYLSSANCTIYDVHPSITAAIFALIGGVYVEMDEGDLITIGFNIQETHRESSVFQPIIRYLTDCENSHSIKIQTLVSEYDYIIHECSPSTCSNDIVDSFIVLICLQGLSCPLVYEKYREYKALSLALDQLKWIWFYLKETFRGYISGENQAEKVAGIKCEIESIINELIPAGDENRTVRSSLFIACLLSWKKLGMRDQDIWVNTNRCSYFDTPSYIRYESGLEKTKDEVEFGHMIDMIHSEQRVPEKFIFAFDFLPHSLRQLYHSMVISSTDIKNSLSIALALSQLLLHLDQSSTIDLNTYFVLPVSYPILKENRLENYALIVFLEKYASVTVDLKQDYTHLMNAIEERQLLDPFLIDSPTSLETFIDAEMLRIHEAMDISQCEERDLRLFAATITTARLLQTQYRPRECYPQNSLPIDLKMATEIYLVIKKIFDPVLRITALSIILEMKDPLMFEEKQRDEIRIEMINELGYVLSEVSLPVATILFVRCYRSSQFLPLSLHHLTSILVEKFDRDEIAIKEAVFVALWQLSDPNLSPCLSKYARQKENISDLLQFKSTVFTDYFKTRTSFGSANKVILSLMYLIELIFDSQYLRVFATEDQNNQVAPLEQLRRLWNQSSNKKKIMTSKVAEWITTNLPVLEKEDRQQLINEVSQCIRVERGAFYVLEGWLDYNSDRQCKFFAQYAALELFLKGSSQTKVTDIIDEMLSNDDDFDRLKSSIEDSIQDKHADPNIIRQILVTLHRHTDRASKFSLFISSIELFELFLELELGRIISNGLASPAPSYRSYLALARGCFLDVENYLLQHFRSYLDFHAAHDADAVKDEFLANVIQWMAESLDQRNENDSFLTELFIYVFPFLSNHMFPLVCKVVIAALNHVYMSFQTSEDSLLLGDEIIANLENLIHSWISFDDDVVALCLLAYGNCLTRLHEFDMSRNVPGESRDLLAQLSASASSEVISIRATFCLCFIEYSMVNTFIISQFLSNRFTMTSVKQYKVLIEQTLFRALDLTHTELVKVIIGRLDTKVTDFLDFFVVDLYQYVCNESRIIYLAGLLTRYIATAKDICKKRSSDFRNAIRNSYFGEENFKKELYLSCKRTPESCIGAFDLYEIFGIITEDFIDLCEGCADTLEVRRLCELNLPHVKEAPDREVIDQLFHTLEFEIYTNKFIIALSLLKHLIKIGAISLLEVHRRLRFVKDMFNDRQIGARSHDEHIFDMLMNISCFKKNQESEPPEPLITSIDISRDFEKVIDTSDKEINFLIENMFSQA